MNLTMNSLVPSGLTLDRETQQVGWGNRKNGGGKDEVTGVNAWSDSSIVQIKSFI